MRTALSEVNEKRSMIEVKNSITIKDAIFWSADAWSNVSVSTIYSSWNMIFGSAEQKIEHSDVVTTSETYGDLDWLDTSFDEPDPGLHVMDDEEIVRFCRKGGVSVDEPIGEAILGATILPISRAVLLLQEIVPTLENEADSSKEELRVFQSVLSRWQQV